MKIDKKYFIFVSLICWILSGILTIVGLIFNNQLIDVLLFNYYFYIAFGVGLLGFLVFIITYLVEINHSIKCRNQSEQEKKMEVFRVFGKEPEKFFSKLEHMLITIQNNGYQIKDVQIQNNDEESNAKREAYIIYFKE